MDGPRPETGFAARALRLCAAAALALALGAGVTACGKKGSPEPPPGEETDYPRAYPDPGTY